MGNQEQMRVAIIVINRERRGQMGCLVVRQHSNATEDLMSV